MLTGLDAVRAAPGHDILGIDVGGLCLPTLARRALHGGEFVPVPVRSAILGDPDSGKAPVGLAWQRGDAECVDWSRADADALNTGILCAGLRVVDVDVDDHAMAEAAHELAERHFGVSPSVRTRDGTGRRAVLYRAAEGAPGKRCISAPKPSRDKLEVLGSGQQLVIYGHHHSGATIRWHGAPGLEVGRDDLPAVDEDAVAAFLNAAAARFGWPAEPAARVYADSGWRPSPTAGRNADMPIADVRACLRAIPNLGGSATYDEWLRVGMACHAATGGSADGLDAWVGWSGIGDRGACTAKWRSFRGGTRVTAGTLIWMARQHEPMLPLTPRRSAVAPSDEEALALLTKVTRRTRKG